MGNNTPMPLVYDDENPNQTSQRRVFYWVLASPEALNDYVLVATVNTRAPTQVLDHTLDVTNGAEFVYPIDEDHHLHGGAQLDVIKTMWPNLERTSKSIEEGFLAPLRFIATEIQADHPLPLPTGNQGAEVLHVVDRRRTHHRGMLSSSEK